MSDIRIHATSTRTKPSRRVTMTRPMFPEGVLSPLLLIALVAIAGFCVQQSDWSRLVIPVVVIAFWSSVFGSVIAKLRVLDSIAHMLSMTFGIGLSFVLVATNAANLEGSVRDRIREIGDVGLRWYLGQRVDDDMEALLVSLLMGIILWLVGYLAAWSLFRRGWIFAAIALPGFLLLVNLGYAEEPRTGYLAAFAVVALVLISRHSLYSRQREWNRLNMGRPSGLVRGFLVTGVVVAIVATSAGWRSPASLSQETLQPLVGEVSSRALSAQESASDWLRDMSGGPQSEIQTSGQFSTFGDTFSVGGPLELTDEPQVLVFADRAPYLTAQHYDAYSGRGWYSTTEESFDPEGINGRRYSPEMTFAANQDVPLSPDVTQSRSTSAVEITSLTPMDDRVLTVDTYLASSVEASVRMSWIQLDEVEFALAGVDIPELPRDIQLVASILASVDLSGDARNGNPTATDPEIQSRIDTEREQLRERFLDVSWAADETGTVTTLTVSGQIPVYDDVEAVFSDDAATGGSYRVVASTSTASPSDLQAAGSDYPDWVLNRYLSLPETITPRTVDLTRSVTAASASPYDQARAVEQYLRSEIVYDETVEAPPGGTDIVDYLLFERSRGYCEYSASAMTVMLRSIGIPARVAVGFYPGDFDQSQGGYLYLQNNAHAWTEVFFPGYGWIPFEPTSSQPLIDGGTGAERGETPMEPSPPIAEPETPVPGTLTAEATPDSIAEDPVGAIPPQVTPESGSGGTRWGLFAAIGAAGAGAVIVAGWLLWILPLRGMSPSNSLFARLRRVGGWVGVSASPTSTPHEFGRAFTERVPQAHNQVDRIVHMYELDQFGPERADSRWIGAAEDAWQSIKRQLPRWIFRRR